MALDFVWRLDLLRHIYGYPIVINSAYRCPSHNNEVSSSGYDGPHTTGKAVDIGVFGERAKNLLVAINTIPMLPAEKIQTILERIECVNIPGVLNLIKRGEMFSGIGISQSTKTPHQKRFIHLDDLPPSSKRPRPWLWGY